MIDWIEEGDYVCKPRNVELLIRWRDKYGRVGHAIAKRGVRGWRICTPWVGAKVDNPSLGEVTHWAEVDLGGA